MSSDDVMVLTDFAFKFSLAMVQFLVVVVVVHCVANSFVNKDYPLPCLYKWSKKNRKMGKVNAWQVGIKPLTRT